MWEVFEKYILSKAELTNSELNVIRSKSRERRLIKRQFYLREGETSNVNTFVIRGLMRLYRIDEEGNEYIMRFAPENWWISDRESYSTGEPSKFNIDALEESIVLVWTKEDMESFFDAIPSLNEFRNKLLANNFNSYHKRLYTSISGTAEERYDFFVKTYPDIFNRVPLHMVASYLGLTRETLSRVRRHYARK